MNAASSAVALGASLWLMVALATATATALAAGALERSIRSLAPARKARAAGLVLIAPALIASGIVALCALPGLLGALSGLGDHCAAHAGHPHFCPIHSRATLNGWIAGPLVFGLALALRMAVALASALLTSRREASWLAARAGGSIAADLTLLEGEPRLALTHGLLRPRIWLSRSLHAALDERERAIVIAHERAHAVRRDSLRALLLRLVGAMHLPGVRARLGALHRLATEQICDAAAVRACGDRLAVAATLLRVERLLRDAHPGPALATASQLASDLPARVEALLAEPSESVERPPLGGVWIAVVTLAGALVGARPVHHAVEHALEFLLRSLVGLRLLS